jgi:rhamnosyltransferase
MIQSKSTEINASQRVNADSVAALIITYNPDGKFIDCVNSISSQVSAITIIDNGSSANSKLLLGMAEKINNNVNIIFNSNNIGLASALNQGIRILTDLNYNWAVTLDQDSTPTPNMVMELLSTLNGCPNIEKIAFVGPSIMDEGSLSSGYKWLSANKHIPILFDRVETKGNDLDDVSVVITSGALTNLKIFQDIGPFRDEFFIDYIDTEYCLRAKNNGYKVMVSAKALMYHNLGNKREVPFLFHSFKPTFHKPFRRYYIARNQITMLKEYAFKNPHWAAYDIVACLYNFFRIIFFEAQRKENILMILKGYTDGFKGKFGELEK